VAKRTLSLEQLAGIPFASTVQTEIEKHLKPIVDAGVLEIDFTGKKQGLYFMSFDTKYTWGAHNQDRCWRYPGLFGETNAVFVDAIRKINYCENVRDCRTCAPVFKHSPDEVGKQIASTALHELGHQFGLNTKTSFAGADVAGHTGDEHNFMFALPNHADYKDIRVDTTHTKKRTIKTGDTLSEIANQVGFRRYAAVQLPWKWLYEFKGQDGRSNQQILRSGNPDLIFPGEEVWVPDYAARRTWRLGLELAAMSFTKPQLDSMTKWIDEGREFVQ
jgi:hypothetical protein